MAKITLKDGEYTFDASAKTITLAPPYDTLNQGQIESILDITTHDDIFKLDSRKHQITLSGAVITHSYNNAAQADTDKLKIVIDTELDYTDADAVLFENILVQPNGIVGDLTSINAQGDFSRTLLFKAITNFSVSAQVTDDGGANPQWFDLCDATGAVITYTLSGNGVDPYAKAIPIYGKGVKARVIAKNTGAVADTPYGGVI